MEQSPQYEVRCPRCDVSFPNGTKRCLHCGGRTGASSLGIARLTRSAQSDVSDAQALEFVPQPVEPGAPLPIGEDEPVGGRRHGLLRTAATLVWVLAAIAFSIMRACSDS